MKLFDFGADAHGVIAIGQQATGVIAIGQLATGVIAIGQLARGIVAVGQLSVGLGSLGMLSLGLVHSTGMLSIGAFARGMARVPLMPSFKRPPAPVLTPLADIDSGRADQGWVAGALTAREGAFRVVERATGRALRVEPGADAPAELLARAGAGTLNVYALVTSRERSAGDDAGQGRVGYREAARVERALACTALEHAPAPPWRQPAWLALTAVRLAALAVVAVAVFFLGAGPALEQLIAAFQ